MVRSYDFVIRIDGMAYPLVKGFSFTRDLKNMASGFELKLVDPEQKLIDSLTPNKECQIEIDEKVLAKVWFYAVSIDDSNGHVYTYYGRDRAGDLIDCSAKFSDGGFERTNITLEGVITDLIKPFDMPLTVRSSSGKPFKRVAITPGDSVFNVIDQLCKWRGVFPLTDGVGGLIITSVSKKRSKGSLVVGEDGNVIGRSGEINFAGRYSKIHVLGQSEMTDFFDAGADKVCNEKGVAYDKGIKRYRPLIIQAEKDGYDLDMQERALFEVRHRKFIGTELTYIVSGWEASKGDFWKVNSAVPVRDENLSIARDMLIKRVTLSRTEEGTMSHITVAPADAYDLPSYKEPEDMVAEGWM